MVDVRTGLEAIAMAAERLAASQPVVIPTETVYGLAGRTCDQAALERIYALKGRPRDNPLIAHVLDAHQAQSITNGWDERCEQLAEAFWPGPLTLVLGRADHVPAMASGGRPTLAVRAPRHEVAQAVIAAVGEPVSAPSANRSGSVSPTTADHVAHDYAGLASAHDLLVLDGGPCTAGIESTVLDLTGPLPRVLRPGTTSMAQLQRVVGPVDHSARTSQGDSPGTMLRHYAPTTPLSLVQADALPAALADCAHAVAVLAGSHVSVPPPHVHLPLGETPDSYAQGLYDMLRRADGLKLNSMLVVWPPDTPAWQAVRDRLTRAAAAS